MTTALSPDTLERLERFVEVFADFDAWRASLPEHERALVSQYDTRVLVYETKDTQPLPAVTLPVESSLNPPDPVPDGVVSSAPESTATNKGRGRPRKTVQ